MFHCWASCILLYWLWSRFLLPFSFQCLSDMPILSMGSRKTLCFNRQMLTTWLELQVRDKIARIYRLGGIFKDEFDTIDKLRGILQKTVNIYLRITSRSRGVTRKHLSVCMQFACRKKREGEEVYKGRQFHSHSDTNDAHSLTRGR